MTERSRNQFPEIPGYRLESILGRGSMATVYRARQTGMDRPVAVKVLSEEVSDNPKLLKRLMREARIAARFNHPHIVRALDAGLHEGSCYFVMELVEGHSIRELVEREGLFDEERVIEVAIELAEALNELSHSHVVHRDVKPANVIIDQDGRALLADLGLAKIEFDSTMTSQHRTVGTPAYMSPEQVKDPDRVDSRSDLFSLGATLFYMFTGNSPHGGTSVSSVLTKILYERAPRLSDVVEGVSDSMDDIVDRLLDKDRQRRYASPAALLRDLRALSRGAELPLGRLAPAGKSSSRKLVLGLAGAAVALVLGVVLWPRSPDEKPVDDTPRVAQRQSSEAGPKVDEAALERDLVRVLRGIELALKAKLASSEVDEARQALKTDWREQFEAGMGASLAELPKIAQLRWENARLEFENLIAVKARERQQVAIAELQALYDERVSRMAERKSYLARAAILDELASQTLPELGGLEQTSLDLAREQAADKLLGLWRVDAAERLEAARQAVAAGDFARSEQLLAELEERKPEVLGESSRLGIDALRKEMKRDLQESSRRVENALAVIDVLPPLGFPEMADREFGAILDRIGPVLESLPEGGSGADESLLVLMGGVLREVAALKPRLVEALRNESFAPTRTLELISGESFRVDQIREVGDDRIKIEDELALPVEIAIARISAETLLELVGPRDDAERERVAIFLAYCDGRLLEVELLLAELEPASPFRKFMTERLERAWVDVAHVRSPEDKEAFRIWSETLAAFRAGQMESAASLSRPLRHDLTLKKSAWYREKRVEIQRVLEDIELRMAVAGSLGAASKSWQLIRKSPPVVRAAWTFASESEAADFRLPPGFDWRDGDIGRRFAVAGASLRPDLMDGLGLALAPDLEAELFTLEFDLATSVRPEEAPRFLVISVAGHHVGILSRLRQTSGFRHLALHGAENLVADYLVLGRVAQWSGKLTDYRQAFSSSLHPKAVVLETGQVYRFQIRIDPKDRMLRVRLDDVEILARKLSTMNLGQKDIEFRAPMPFAIRNLSVESALKLD